MISAVRKHHLFQDQTLFVVRPGRGSGTIRRHLGETDGHTKSDPKFQPRESHRKQGNKMKDFTHI